MHSTSGVPRKGHRATLHTSWNCGRNAATRREREEKRDEMSERTTKEREMGRGRERGVGERHRPTYTRFRNDVKEKKASIGSFLSPVAIDFVIQSSEAQRSQRFRGLRGLRRGSEISEIQ
eukprot:scaffold1378_cov257-Pinguiococcus_pyrenoidosus.AAC.18